MSTPRRITRLAVASTSTPRAAVKTSRSPADHHTMRQRWHRLVEQVQARGGSPEDVEVLFEHHPDDFSYCMECMPRMLVAWPCAPVRRIAAALEIDP